MHSTRLVLWACISALLLAPSAHAVPLFPELIMIEQSGVAGSMAISSDDLGCAAQGAGSDVYSCQGLGQTFVPANPNYTLEISNWNIEFDLDPSVSQEFGFVNTGATATFTLVTSIPIAPILTSTVMGGSTGGSTTDANFDGAGGISTVAPDAWFVGLTDGVPVVPTTELHPDPFSVGYLFPGHTASIPSLTFGLPGPTVAGPPVATSIGIRNTFSLSAGDSVASTNLFVVEAAPEPGTAALLGLGIVAMAAGRRLRR